MSQTLENVQQDKPLGAYQTHRVVTMAGAKFVYISGLTSGDASPFDVAEQTRVVFHKIKSLLVAEGGGLEHLVKINTYLVDIREYPQYNEVRNDIMSGLSVLPASATIGGAELIRRGARIEIDGVAIIPVES